MKKSWYWRCRRVPSGSTSTMPGGIDCHVSSLLTTTVSRHSSPGVTSVGHVGLEGRVAALVLGDEGVVRSTRWRGGSPRRTGARRAVRPSPGERRLAAGTRRRRHDRAARDPPRTSLKLLGTGMRRASGRVGPPPASGAAHSGRVGRETPDAVESLGLACRWCPAVAASCLPLRCSGVRRRVAAEQSEHDVRDGFRRAARPCRGSRSPPAGRARTAFRPWRRRSPPARLRGEGGDRRGGPARPASTGWSEARRRMQSARAARTTGSSTTPPGAASTVGVSSRRTSSTTSDSR